MSSWGFCSPLFSHESVILVVDETSGTRENENSTQKGSMWSRSQTQDLFAVKHEY